MSMIGSASSHRYEEIAYAEDVLSKALGAPGMRLRTAAFEAARAINEYKQGNNEFKVVVEEKIQQPEYQYQNEIRELKCTPFSRRTGKQEPVFYAEVLVPKNADFSVCVQEFRRLANLFQWGGVLVEPGRDSKLSDVSYLVTVPDEDC